MMGSDYYTIDTPLQIDTECIMRTEELVNSIIREYIKDIENHGIPYNISITDDKGCAAYAKNLFNIGSLEITK